MAMRRLLVATALFMAVVAAVALRPQPARADNLQYIIPAALGGVAIVVVLVAIVISEHKSEPELDLADRLRPAVDPSRAVHLAPACRPIENGLPLICW